MAQGILPFQCEIEKRDGGMTALAGLPLYLEFAHFRGLSLLIADHDRLGRTIRAGLTTR